MFFWDKVLTCHEIIAAMRQNTSPKYLKAAPAAGFEATQAKAKVKLEESAEFLEVNETALV